MRLTDMFDGFDFARIFLCSEEEGGGAGSLDGGGNDSNDANAGAASFDMSGSVEAVAGDPGSNTGADPNASQSADNSGGSQGGSTGASNGPFSSGPVNLDTAATNQTLAPGQTVTMLSGGFAMAGLIAAGVGEIEVGVGIAAAAAAINIAVGMSQSAQTAYGAVLETPGGPATISNMSVFETASVIDTNNYGNVAGGVGVVTIQPDPGAYGYPGNAAVAWDQNNHSVVAFGNGAQVTLS